MAGCPVACGMTMQCISVPYPKLSRDENTVSVLPSWELSGVGILANKARGPRALLAIIPTPLNFQLGNTGSISHLTNRNNQQISLKTGLGNTKKNVLGNTKNCIRQY